MLAIGCVCALYKPKKSHIIIIQSTTYACVCGETPHIYKLKSKSLSTADLGQCC